MDETSYANLISKPMRLLKNASEISGLSVWYLRNGCKAGTIPHIRVGNRYYVNVPKLLAMINSQSTGS